VSWTAGGCVAALRCFGVPGKVGPVSREKQALTIRQLPLRSGSFVTSITLNRLDSDFAATEINGQWGALCGGNGSTGHQQGQADRQCDTQISAKEGRRRFA
jgi:hypothetical protein